MLQSGEIDSQNSHNSHIGSMVGKPMYFMTKTEIVSLTSFVSPFPEMVVFKKDIQWPDKNVVRRNVSAQA